MAVYSLFICSLKGHQLYLPKKRIMKGVNNGSMTNAYSNNTMMTTVAICNKDNTPEGSNAPNVPPRMIVAEIMTVPIFFIVSINASLMKPFLYSLKRSINFLASSLEGFFDFIFFIASRSINGIDAFLMAMPWWMFILIIFALGSYFKSLASGFMFSLFIFLIGTFGLWEDMMTTIAIILTAVAISLIIGIPIGIWMSFSQLVSNFMRPILDAMQTMPSFVYLIPAIFFFGLGNVSAIFATLIYAVPPVIRLT